MIIMYLEYPNPLSEESKNYLKVYELKNPSIKVGYDNKI
jgi:hypothetical protein